MSKNYKILKVKDSTDNNHIEHFPFSLPAKILINGKSQLSGKSTVILNLLLNPQFGYDKLFEPEHIHVVSNNQLDNKLKILMDKLDIPEDNHMVFNESELEMLYDDIEDEFKDSIMEGEKPSHHLIIIDDVAYSGGLSNYKKENIIDKLVCNGRHALISTIFTSQKYSQTSTCLRTNITGAILFGTNMKELDLISDDMSYYPKKSDFVKMFKKVTTKPRSFLVVNYSKTPQLYYNSNFEPIEWNDGSN
tara:strand:- start:905 stop:1648 length:744 start_codon:yes stop_codon:yes gene_type:complete